MIKTLWLCNVLIPEAAQILGKTYRPVGGWLSGALNALLLYPNNITISLVCPSDSDLCRKGDDFTLYTFFNNIDNTKYNPKLKDVFVKILQNATPDVIHIWGSEFPHSLSMIEAAEQCGLANRTIIHIQGLMHIYEKHYFANLPLRIRYGFSFRDIIKRNNVYLAKKYAAKRGKYEIEALRRTYAVAGRTNWDRACTFLVNDKVKYYHCREVLRDCFYTGSWEYEKCNKHQIFFSQPVGIVKSFYQLLKVFPDVLSRYPDARIVTTGNLVPKTFLARFMQSCFHRYMYKIIKKNRLEHAIDFRGNMSAEEMKEAYLSSNVFISTSSIENSPNSLGEAMLLGVPCISSDVGGTNQMLCADEEGFIYPFDEEYMLLWYILKVFQEEDQLSSLSEKAKIHAQHNQSKEGFVNDILQMYKSVISNEKDCNTHTR